MNPSAEADAVGVILFVVIAAYALFGGADFGGGIWDLLAGGAERGTAPRRLVDEAITPVWEANHVWLVFVLVLLWTAFPPAFAAIMTALFVPLSLSLLGIVLRGVGFAFRHTAARLQMQRLNGALFAASSLITPFFLGTVVGAVATGRVPVHPGGNELAAWTSPAAVLTGLLFVAACAYISGVFLVLEARQRGHQDLTRYFRLRATGAGLLTGALAGAAFGELSAGAPHVFTRLTGIALPLVAISVAAGIAVLGMLWLRWYHPLFLRLTAAVAVATVVWGWGLAQYPYLLPTGTVPGRRQRAYRGPGSRIGRRGPGSAAGGAGVRPAVCAAATPPAGGRGNGCRPAAGCPARTGRCWSAGNDRRRRLTRGPDDDGARADVACYPGDQRRIRTITSPVR